MTGRGVGLLAAIAACGGAQASRPGPPSNEHGAGTAAGEHHERTVDPAAVCDRILALRSDGCATFSGYGLDRDECILDFRRSFEERGDDARSAATTAGRCILDGHTCGEIGTCLESLIGPDPGLRECGDRGSSAAVGRPRDQWEQRRGAGATRLSQIASTKDEPIEVCTIPEEMTWLTQVRCDDGSIPLPDYDHAHAARVRNVGPGGACGSIIDLYEVPCPEGTYQVYMDAYVCPLP